jgi:orotate phosphoribosyltransferase
VRLAREVDSLGKVNPAGLWLAGFFATKVGKIVWEVLSLDMKEVQAVLQQAGVYKHGHFQFTSGLHSDVYLEKFQVMQYPEYTAILCAEMARRTRHLKPDVVIGPAVGGIILAYELGRQLERRALFTERVEGKMQLRRGFSVAPGERVLLVEDIVTTGGSAREVLEAISPLQAQVVGITCLVDRSDGQVQFPVDFYPLLSMDITSWDPKDCPMCQQNIPLVIPGSRNLQYI